MSDAGAGELRGHAVMGDVRVEAPAYAAALEQYTDPRRSHFAAHSLPRLLLGPVPLEHLQAAIPREPTPECYVGVDRSRDRDDRRLSGIRLPVSETDERARVARWRGTPEPPFYSWSWVAWAMCRRAAELLDELDAERVWENEGGSQPSGYRPLPYPLTRCLRCNSVRDISEMVFSEWNVRGREWPAGIWTHRRFCCMPCHQRDYPEDRRR